MKVKIFTSQGDEAKLEEEINQWLREKNVSLSSSQIKQNYIYDTKNNALCSLVSVWYEPQFEK